jgi:hypothetical protein
MAPVTFGRIEGGAVGSALESLKSHFSELSTCVVRSIDSIHDPADLRYALEAHGVQNSVIDGNVCIQGLDLFAAAVAGVFSGFDEVWVFCGSPPNFSLAQLPGATSDTTDFGVGFPEVLRLAFEESHCMLLLADGNGLNFATVVRPISDKLLEDAQPS